MTSSPNSAAPEQLAHERISEAHARVADLRAEIGRVVIGQERLVDRLVMALLIRGHVLVEGLPGLAKTLLVKTLAGSLDAAFKRVQFTPDLLPADITGTLVFDPATGRFSPRLGPIFTNLLLADEINRAPAKVQSALLEAMQERQVTIGDTTHPLPDPFLVIATQNPIEHEGTYALPEAQVDRFVMKLLVTYPTAEEESRMLALYLDPTKPAAESRRVLNLDVVRQLSSTVASVHLDQRISSYIVSLVNATRRPAEIGLSSLVPFIAFGASPRATLALAHVAKANAFLEGRPFVTPEDVKEIAHDVLRHRLILTYEAAAEQLSAERIISQILGTIAVP